ncbi:lipoate--protein ligase family protein [Sporolactobacillus vineae]|uniref:lipoate--protein ligase family protein n=1 Tax=Sporolactobacillus vineae TaxID=444463 RepID=UPI000288C484|nr:biotin/lipoate A/B protein ligase family protein [Sporolactobacillus vineae]
MRQRTWLFIDSGCHTPSYNMALDEYLLDREASGSRRPILRFYQWDPPGLSIGYFQKTRGRISREGLKKRGVRLVRRLTGGLAVLHDHELTYSVILPEDYPDMPTSVVGAYRVLSAGLLEGFRALHLHAELAIPERKSQKSHSPVCFEEASWYELVVEGRKAAGSSQTRRKGMILQHGSIPLSVDDGKLFDCFSYPSARVRDRAQQAFGGKAVTLEELTGRKLTLEEVGKAFYHGFEKGLGIELKKSELTVDEDRSVNALARSKYESESWNFSR